MINEVKIYQAYIKAKASDGKITNIAVAKAHGIKLRQLYVIVARVAVGNVAKYKACTEKSRLDCAWEYKFKARFLAIPKGRRRESIRLLRELVRDMTDDGFSANEIGKRIKKKRRMVMNYLNGVWEHGKKVELKKIIT